MKILSSDQIRRADQYTIANEPIASIDLMERASQAFVDEFIRIFKSKKKIHCFCGIGNNGGDGLAVSRLLQEKGWEVSTYVIGDPDKGSEDFKLNSERVNWTLIVEDSNYPAIEDSIIIDALFGSGLSRPLEGTVEQLVQYLNGIEANRVAVDIPSGLYADKSLTKGSVVFKAHYTISFQVPKLSFLLPETGSYVGDWRIVNIGLLKQIIEELPSGHILSEEKDFASLVPKRKRFEHKNSIGKLLVVAGSKGKIGAAVLCAKAALRAGVGLINVRLPGCGTQIMQSSVVEAMVIEDDSENQISAIPGTEEVMAVGPGLGTGDETKKALGEFLRSRRSPLVLDADALNIISEESLLDQVPPESILTPHPGEFRRLVGSWDNDFEKLELLTAFCKKYQLNVVLKGAFSAVCNSEGQIFFNPTGNPGMATAGSGDVLTGIVSALLAQGLKPINALRLGVYIHGLSGDLASKSKGEISLIASDIVEHISNAFIQTCV